MLENFIQLITALQHNPFSLPVFVLLYSAACFIVPVSLFPVAGGILFGLKWGVVINLLTVTLGASGPFMIARLYGKKTADRLVQKINHPRIVDFLENPGPGSFILIRLVGFPPFVLTNYLAGLSSMPYRVFLWTSLVGLLPWTFLMTYFARTFWAVLRSAGIDGFRQALTEHMKPLLIGGLIMGCLMVLGAFLSGRSGRKA